MGEGVLLDVYFLKHIFTSHHFGAVREFLIVDRSYHSFSGCSEYLRAIGETTERGFAAHVSDVMIASKCPCRSCYRYICGLHLQAIQDDRSKDRIPMDFSCAHCGRVWKEETSS